MRAIEGIMLKRGRAQLESGLIIRVRDCRFSFGDKILINYDFTRDRVGSIELEREVIADIEREIFQDEPEDETQYNEYQNDIEG